VFCIRITRQNGVCESFYSIEPTKWGHNARFHALSYILKVYQTPFTGESSKKVKA